MLKMQIWGPHSPSKSESLQVGPIICNLTTPRVKFMLTEVMHYTKKEFEKEREREREHRDMIKALIIAICYEGHHKEACRRCSILTIVVVEKPVLIYLKK